MTPEVLDSWNSAGVVYRLMAGIADAVYRFLRKNLSTEHLNSKHPISGGFAGHRKVSRYSWARQFPRKRLQCDRQARGLAFGRPPKMSS